MNPVVRLTLPSRLKRGLARRVRLLAERLEGAATAPSTANGEWFVARGCWQLTARR